jgi:DNA-binding MarR family transcriptional regulator
MEERTKGHGDAPQWLNAKELAAWQSVTLLLARLPTALESQLRHDAQLSYVEYYVLAGLSDHPDWTMQLSDLAVLTNSELSRMSHVVDRLESRGFVQRVPHPTDRRCTNAVLTDKGHKHLVAAAPGHVEAVRNLVVDPLGDDGLEAFQAAALRIIDRIERAGR